MLKKRNKGNLSLYGVVLCGFILMFAFILPSCDVFVFNRDTVNTFSSAVDYSLHYGNGRFLGNFLAVVFSYKFYLAGLIIACTLTLMVYCLNRLLFDNHSLTIMPIALCLAMPCKSMVSECYYMFCAFLNYVLPVALVLLALVVLRRINKANMSKPVNIILHISLLVLMFASCLFSENTTIILAVLVILVCASDVLSHKKLRISSMVSLISVVLGGVVMLAIPLVTQTASKMEGYREVSNTIPALLDTMVGNFVAFATFFSTFLPLLILLTAALIFTLRKNCTVQKVTDPLTFVLIVYPLSCIAFSLVDTNPRRLNWIYLLQTILLVMYLFAAIVTLLRIQNKRILKISVAFVVLILFSVGPMMIVNQYGYRTFYATYIIVFFFAAYLLKQYAPKSIVAYIQNGRLSKKILSTGCAVVFMFVSVFLLTQTLYNFAFYAVRADDIICQLETSDTVEVPMLPCYICSMEDEYFNIVSQSIGISLENVKLIDLYTSDNSSAYISISQASPVTIIKTVLNNLDCYDPAYFDNLK